MKKILFLFVFAFAFLTSCSKDETTTYYLIRHAEKDRTDKTNRNPNLNEKGKERAKKWATYFKDIQLNAIYATNYNRTQQTAAPTANSKNLEVKSYNPSKLYDSDFKANTKGKSVVIVGHSNTTPDFANAILGDKRYEWMKDNDNSSLYKITLNTHQIKSEIIKVEL
ncbi:phosphoglycerate mutase family protein [uncultured Polaribacter sp.]|uniref:SixA phosphatase family protein n=1 Tax=uncultured Polaribacter sp. TaxID=174711 RepID=UPI00262085EF|nr:phosphoglycerate mutase family protein [uncultured Polaribacter sp.]